MAEDQPTKTPTQKLLFSSDSESEAPVAGHIVPTGKRAALYSAIIADFDTGMSLTAIAKKHGKASTTVANVLERFGVATPRRRGSFVRHHDSIVADYNSGMTTRQVAKKYGMCKAGVTHILHKHGVDTKSRMGSPKRTPEICYFADRVISTETQAWMLGFFTADASVSNRAFYLALKREDRGTLEFIAREFGIQPRKIRDYDAKLNDKLFPNSRLCVYSKQLVSDLAAFGIVPNKTFTVPFWDGPDHLMAPYLRGLWDGDGSIFRAKKGTQWYMALAGNEHITSGAAKAIKKLSWIEPCLLEKRKDANSWTLKYWGQTTVQRLCEKIYGSSTTNAYLPRKMTLAKQIMSSSFIDRTDWESMSLDYMLQLHSEYGSWLEVARHLGLRRAQVANYVNRQRRLSRGIRC